MKALYKKIIKSADFAAVIALFCLPPVCAPASADTIIPRAAPAALILAAIHILAIGTLAYLKRPSPAEKQKPSYRITIGYAAVSLLLMFASSVFCGALARITGADQNTVRSAAPAGAMLLQIILFATREEVLYRYYLINAGRYAGLPFLVAAALSIVLFAAAHISAGIYAALNALFCGIILTYCMNKTQSIAFPIIIHIVYNSLLFFTAV